MNFPKTNSFPQSVMHERSMGPNPLKLCEELLAYGDIPTSSVVLDLGSGAVARHARRVDAEVGVRGSGKGACPRIA